jgi:hypothetical protein
MTSDELRQSVRQLNKFLHCQQGNTYPEIYFKPLNRVSNVKNDIFSYHRFNQSSYKDSNNFKISCIKNFRAYFSNYDYSYHSQIWSPQNLHINLCYFVREFNFGLTVQTASNRENRQNVLWRFQLYFPFNSSFYITIMRTIHIINTEHVTL